jgi:PTS system nitrogen regulatory IIA component
MDIADLIQPEGVVAKLRVTSKKQALQELAKRAADLTGQPERAIFEVLVKRERLGTTGVGSGIPETAGADHLKALARVSRLLRDPAICEKLRGTDKPDAIYALLTESATSHAA